MVDGSGRPEIRVVTPADWSLWREARIASLTVSPEAFKVRLADWDRGGEEQWRARFDDPAAYGVLAVLGGRPVGLAAGLLAPDAVPELRSVWVAREARGHGLAARLIGSVESWAHGTGADTLRLSVLAANAPAVALYERLGYAADGGTGEELVMTKRLSGTS
ncbi:GNAT family N-acetyltransferase [Streptomyces tanashiensis]|uniref:GNAT family N-acetyltransferase n=1 Tax=Streptomyces tanashiensis TaxID=67367 RepID=A0ABY6R6M1_9ACTN|nr:GNAT family N-acetyltransferase [Streptomyces tanashiensis]UZX24344.1 GNAT family N-acetyltransferase [Streptomyces tanashiensis]GGY12598.1 N-acetyltransferase [Streptomyces tanashiensis]